VEGAAAFGEELSGDGGLEEGGAADVGAGVARRCDNVFEVRIADGEEQDLVVAGEMGEAGGGFRAP
jgi:hypothetical protein